MMSKCIERRHALSQRPSGSARGALGVMWHPSDPLIDHRRSSGEVAANLMLSRYLNTLQFKITVSATRTMWGSSGFNEHVNESGL